MKGVLAVRSEIWIIAFSTTVLVLINGNLMAGAGHCWIKIGQAAIFNKYRCVLRAQIHRNELLIDRGEVGREIQRKSRGRHRQEAPITNPIASTLSAPPLYSFSLTYWPAKWSISWHIFHDMDDSGLGAPEWSRFLLWLNGAGLYGGRTARNDGGRATTINYKFSPDKEIRFIGKAEN